MDDYDRKILPQGALIEFIAVGTFVKVTALDPVSLIEVSLIGDPHLGKNSLAREAMRKLERMVRKHQQQQQQTQTRRKKQGPPDDDDNGHEGGHDILV